MGRRGENRFPHVTTFDDDEEEKRRKRREREKERERETAAALKVLKFRFFCIEEVLPFVCTRLRL